MYANDQTISPAKKETPTNGVQQAAKVKVIFVSFETLQRPQNVDVFIPAWNQSLQTWQRQVATHTKPVPNQSTSKHTTTTIYLSISPQKHHN